MYSSGGQPPAPFNGNGTVYFAPPPSAQHPPAHFHPFHPGRTFENSTRQQFTHFPPSNMFLPPPPSSMDGGPRFRHVNASEPLPPRPISGDFERLGNSAPARSQPDPRFHSRPKSFYEFSSVHHRYPSLPLSAYMNAGDSSHSHGQVNAEKQWNSSYQRRRPYNPDKHQFPLSSYDPRQYGFSNPPRRHELSNGHRRPANNTRAANPPRNDSHEIDLIEEWWEDENNTELIGSKPNIFNDSGHSSLSASLVNISEATANDAPHSTTDSQSLLLLRRRHPTIALL